MSTTLPMDQESPRLQEQAICSWGTNACPLPVGIVRPVGRVREPSGGVVAPGWLASGPDHRPFDFSRHMRRLAADVAARCQVFHPIDVRRLLFTGVQARNNRAHGLQARVTPLRFRDGALTRRRRGQLYQVQRFVVDGREMLYVIGFCLPRFLDQSFEDKLITLFHELYHISPQFNGDLRRLGGRYAIHSCSKRGYDDHMAELVRAYLADGADPALHGFLRLNFAQLQSRHGHVKAVMVPRPKLIPLPSRRHAAAAIGRDAAAASRRERGGRS